MKIIIYIAGMLIGVAGCTAIIAIVCAKMSASIEAKLHELTCEVNALRMVVDDTQQFITSMNKTSDYKNLGGNDKINTKIKKIECEFVFDCGRVGSMCEYCIHTHAVTTHPCTDLHNDREQTKTKTNKSLYTCTLI